MSLRIGPYITALVSKPKAHNVITYWSLYHCFSLKTKSSQCHYVLVLISLLKSQNQKLTMSLRIGPYITALVSKPKAHNVITYWSLYHFFILKTKSSQCHCVLVLISLL